MAVYIRHAKDRKRGRDTRTDTSLTTRGKSEAESVARQLLSRFGAPQQIRCSAYRRARQTAHCMCLYLADRGIQVEIVVEEDLCRYNGGDSSDCEVRPDTAEYCVPTYESKTDMKRRVFRHAEKSRDRYIRRGVSTWYVTHAIIVRQSGKACDISSPKRIDSCAWVDLVTGLSSW